MATPFVRFKIPVGSTFEVQVSGDAAAVSEGFFQPCAQAMPWTDAQLRAGRRAPLNVAGTYYQGHIDLQFGAAATATLSMAVLKPDGSVHAPPRYNQSFTGGPGDLERIYITLKTLN